MNDSVGAEDVGQSDDAEYFADVGTAHDRERVEMRAAETYFHRPDSRSESERVLRLAGAHGE